MLSDLLNSKIKSASIQRFKGKINRKICSDCRLIDLTENLICLPKYRSCLSTKGVEMQYYKSGDNFNDFVLGIFPLNTNCDILSDSFLTFERQIRWNLWNLWKKKSAATSALSLSPQFTQLTTKTFEQWNCAALSSKRFPVFNNVDRCLQSLTSPLHPTLKKCVTMSSACVNYRFQADQRVCDNVSNVLI